MKVPNPISRQVELHVAQRRHGPTSGSGRATEKDQRCGGGSVGNEWLSVRMLI